MQENTCLDKTKLEQHLQFQKKLTYLINRYMDDYNKIPDFILAELISNFILTLNTVKTTLDWHEKNI